MASSSILIKFVIHAAINWIKTPDLMKLWGKNPSDSCTLCKVSPCSIHHILSNCEHALNDRRYAWRHDSVLLTMEEGLRPFLESFNEKHTPAKIPPLMSNFVKPNAKTKKVDRKSPFSESILTGASDWQMLVDYDHRRIEFPPEIFATPQRPDIIIWSCSLKKVFLVEQTCPAEEGIQEANTRKSIRYATLTDNIKLKTHWTATTIPYEVGARGFVAISTHRCLKKLGLDGLARKKLIRNLGKVSARCSYAIYLARSNAKWDRKRVLLHPEEVSE